MSENTNAVEAGDEALLTFEVSDDALEAAASTTALAAMSLPAAPTVNVLVMCCGNNID